MEITVESTAVSWSVTLPRIERPDGTTEQVQIPCGTEAVALALKAALERLVAEEREACAKIAEEHECPQCEIAHSADADVQTDIAAEIRARATPLHGHGISSI